MSALREEVRKLREKLEDAQKKIDQLMQERSDYLRVGAHQMKGPLSTISFSIDTLLKEYAGRLSWRQLRVIESIKNSTDALQNLVHDILELERLREEELRLETVDFLNICTEVIDTLRGKIQEKDIILEVNVPHRVLITMGTKLALRQVVMNLLENSIKYSHPHGEIVFTVGYDEKEKTISCTVKDNGIGIPETDQEKIFQEFYRAPNARRFDHTGTGFGMTIVKRVLELCGGKINIYSKENAGTKVTFTIPLIKDKEIAPQREIKEIKRKRIIVIGGVAAGPKAASRARRLDPDAEITLFEKGYFLAYAGCALPYYISGQIKTRRELSEALTGFHDAAEFFRVVKGIDVKNLTEVIKIDRENKKVLYCDLVTDRVNSLPYDVLILATGSIPIKPDIEGIDLNNIFELHGIQDADRIKQAIVNDMAREIVIMGGGLIGVEIAEALTVSGARVTIVEKKDQILPFLDPEMAALVEKHLDHKGVRIIKNEEVKAFSGHGKVEYVHLSREKIPAEMVIVAVGITPNVELARKAGLKIGTTGAISVNEYLQTSDPSIYAVGDCAETWHVVLNKPYYLPLGSIANKQGRVAGSNATGKAYKFAPVVGTIIIKVFDYHIAKAGLSEKEAKGNGFNPVCCYVPEYDKEHFIPGAQIINIKLIACSETRKLLGAQILGKGEIAKRIDLVSTVILKNGKVEDLLTLDLGYAPVYSNAMGALIVSANVLQNKLEGLFEGFTAPQVLKLLEIEKSRYSFIDVRSVQSFEKERIPGFDSIPLETLRNRIDEVPRNKGIILACESGAKSFQAALILKANGFRDVKILEGGLRMWPYRVSRE